MKNKMKQINLITAMALLVASLLATSCKSAPPVAGEGEAVKSAPQAACPTPASESAMGFIEAWADLNEEAQDLSEGAGALRASWPADAPLIVARAWRVDGAQWMALLSPDPERAEGEAILLTVERSSEDGMWRQAMPAQVTKIDTLWPTL